MVKQAIKQLAEKIVDNAPRYKAVIRQLEMRGSNGKTLDYCDFDKNGKPKETTYLEMVKLGLTGLSMKDIKEMLIT